MKHIIWDYNGTLLNDVDLAVRTDNAVFTKLGLPLIDRETYCRHITMPISDFYRSLGVDLEKYPFDLINRLWLDVFNTQASDAGLFPGIKDVLEECRNRGITQSILSACHEPELKKQCAELGLTGYMCIIDGHSDEGAGLKTELGRKQMQKLNLREEDVVLVGDMSADADLARVLGVPCILVSWGHSDEKRLEETGFPVARSAAELKTLLGCGI